MFSGIVEECGRVALVTGEGDQARRLEISCSARLAQGLAVGDSIAVNGCCLTATRVGPEGFSADVMGETLRRTTLGRLASGDQVDLEAALRLGDRVGGHLVSGHVDGIGRIASIEVASDATVVGIEPPPNLLAYIAPQGSVAVDGISLTIVDVAAAGFSVSLIPHTLAATVAGGWGEGDLVNIEADQTVRQIHRAVAAFVTRPTD